MAQDVRKIKTKREIQQAILQLLTQKSFRKITVADICELSMTSRSTFYDHYLDKYDLLDKLVGQYEDIFKRAVHTRFRQMIEGHADLLVQGVVSDWAENRQAINILFEIHEPEADLQASFRAMLLQEWLNYVQTEGQNMTVPSDLIAEMGTSVQMTVIKWALQNGIDAKDEIAGAVNTIRQALLEQVGSTNEA